MSTPADTGDGTVRTEPDSVVFVAAQVPALTAGRYEITLTQPLTRSPGVPLIDPPTVPGGLPPEPSQRARIHVLGPRLVLEPSTIESRFPQASADGQDAGVLPHVVLARATLPWERDARRAAPDREIRPWLAVLLLTEAEIAGADGLPGVQEDQDTVASLRTAAPAGAPAFPGLPGDEPGPADAELVRVVDVPRALLADLLPDASWLTSLTHVRERFVCAAPRALADDLDRAVLPPALHDLLAGHGRLLGPDTRVQVEIPGAEWRIDGDSTLVVERPEAGDLTVADEARAVIVGCRPTVPGRQRAYLVSLEGRYVERRRRSKNPERFEFDFGTARQDADLVRLVVLDRWEFGVDARVQRLHDLLAGLGRSGALGLTVPTDTARGPGVDILRAGFALLPHRLRTGGRVLTWYRGPLVAHRERPALPPAPHKMSDALLARDWRTGMFVASYAAAWELGRTLTLADPAVALDLLRWKTENRRHTHRRTVAGDAPHQDTPAAAAPGMPSAVLAWLQRLLVLDGVPFGYLVPDPAMLPPESLRTFRLDQTWLECLLDGAFSVGRVLAADVRTDAALLGDALRAADRHLSAPTEVQTEEQTEVRTEGQTAGQIEGQAEVWAGPRTRATLSGCLIRSEVLSGWPELHVDGWSGPDRTPGQRCPVARRARLSDNIALVLFLGDVAMIDVHPNPEALHHGLTFDDDPGAQVRWSVIPRRPDGSPDPHADPVPMPMRPRRDVLDVARARDALGTGLRSDTFALRLVAGVPRLVVTVQ